MPRFTIVPIDRSYPSAEITALDAGRVLNIVEQLDCDSADVLQDRCYAFSVRLSGNGMWTIFQRPVESGSKAFPHLVDIAQDQL